MFFLYNFGFQILPSDGVIRIALLTQVSWLNKFDSDAFSFIFPGYMTKIVVSRTCRDYMKGTILVHVKLE